MIPFAEGVITGIAGVLLNEGRRRGFDVLTFLAEAQSDYPDARAAAKVIETINAILLRTPLDAGAALRGGRADRATAAVDPAPRVRPDADRERGVDPAADVPLDGTRSSSSRTPATRASTSASVLYK